MRLWIAIGLAAAIFIAAIAVDAERVACIVTGHTIIFAWESCAF